MTPADRWIRERLNDAPPALRDAMLTALPTSAEHDAPEALALAALTLYRQVLAAGSGRQVALPLLAADALMTHALQACAERDIDGLAAFAAEWGAAGRLRELSEAAV